jgi:hypothetical protein
VVLGVINFWKVFVMKHEMFKGKKEGNLQAEVHQYHILNIPTFSRIEADNL